MGKRSLKPESVYFPFEKVRPIQVDLLADVDEAIRTRKGILAHAPTGLGKTVASLAPALKHAIEKDLTVYFLTGRHTQHKIAIDTLQQIRERYELDFQVSDLIGKKWMCAQSGVGSLYTSEFYEYCKAMREENKCEYYTRARKTATKLTTEGKLVLKELENLGPSHVEEMVRLCSDRDVCPYELAAAMASKAKVIVTDYFYMFHPDIRNNFFRRTNKKLEKAIVIVDEGHNLPGRLRDLMSSRLSTYRIRQAVKEAKKHGYKHVIPMLTSVQDRLNDLSTKLKINDEKLIKKHHVSSAFGRPSEYLEALDAFTLAAEHVLQEQKRSSLATIANFMEAWSGQDEGFTRILSLDEVGRTPTATVTYRCLDPSIMSVDVVNEAHSLIIMSGTLRPLEMYRDLLGMEKAMLRKYPSPFPQKNRLAIVSTSATTQYKKRGPQQYERMARLCAGIANRIPGNSAAFFPSYFLRDEVSKRMDALLEKTTFLEVSRMNKSQKADLLERFASYQKTGAVLLGVASGSFSEGIDYKGDLLKGVVIVGLPLTRPDMETKSLIDYYDKKFGKGWNYGYVFPAMNRVLQSAGRCIRSSKDRGIIVFLDMRYAWPNYLECLPREEWGIQLVHDPEECFSLIEGFFEDGETQ